MESSRSNIKMLHTTEYINAVNIPVRIWFQFHGASETEENYSLNLIFSDTGAWVGFNDSFAQGCTQGHCQGGSFQVLCLRLGVRYKLPSDHAFCASYIVGRHQVN